MTGEAVGKTHHLVIVRTAGRTGKRCGSLRVMTAAQATSGDARAGAALSMRVRCG